MRRASARRVRHVGHRHACNSRLSSSKIFRSFLVVPTFCASENNVISRHKSNWFYSILQCLSTCSNTEESHFRNTRIVWEIFLLLFSSGIFKVIKVWYTYAMTIINLRLILNLNQLLLFIQKYARTGFFSEEVFFCKSRILKLDVSQRS